MSAAFTPGSWKAVAMGGSSTVVVPCKPKRNDSRIPAFGYDEQRGHCIAYPFTNDDGTTRLDFVCFSHDDARLIAAAPALLEALEDARTSLSITRTNIMCEIRRCADPSESRWEGVPEQLAKRIAKIDAAISLAKGESA